MEVDTMRQKQGSSPKLKRANGPRKADEAKAGRRCPTSKGRRKDYTFRQDNTYSYGLESDKLKARGLVMFDYLRPYMHSPAEEADNSLKWALEIYIKNFSDIKFMRTEHPIRRHERACEIAIKGLNQSLGNYANRQFATAFKITRPR